DLTGVDGEALDRLRDTMATSGGATAILRARFEEVARRHAAAIGRTTRSYAKTAAEREDLEQEIAIAIWRALPTFRDECSERSFAGRTAPKQRLSCATRRRSRLEPARAPPDDVRDPGPDPEVLAGLSERMRRVFNAIHALPFGQRQVLVLALEG